MQNLRGLVKVGSLFSQFMSAVLKEMTNSFSMPVTCTCINPIYNRLHIRSVILKEDCNQVSKMASLSSVRQSIAGKQRFHQHALPNTRSRVGCSTNEKSLLWAVLTDAFQRGLHTCFCDVRALTLGSSSEQFHFPTSSTSLLCSMEYPRSNDALSR